MMRAFLINLDRQPERLASATQELNRLNLQISRLSATDMQKLTPEKGDLVTLGVKACWQSHRSVFRIISQENLPYALIFEDDITIREYARITEFLRNFEFSDWDLIQLGFITPGIQNKLLRNFKNLESSVFRGIAAITRLLPGNTRMLSNRMRVRLALTTPKGFVPDDFLPGTHAYLVSNRLANKSLLLNSPQFLSADDYFVALSHMRSFKCIRSRTSLFAQRNLPGMGKDRFINQV